MGTQIWGTCGYIDMGDMWVHRYGGHVGTQIWGTCGYTDMGDMWVHR